MNACDVVGWLKKPCGDGVVADSFTGLLERQRKIFQTLIRNDLKQYVCVCVGFKTCLTFPFLQKFTAPDFSQILHQAAVWHCDVPRSPGSTGDLAATIALFESRPFVEEMVMESWGYRRG